MERISFIDALRWLNLDWDEGPVFQSERAERHREVLGQLLSSGHAYHSNATADDVQLFKQRHGFEQGFRGVEEESGAVRLRVPDEGETVFDDVIRGQIRFANASLAKLCGRAADELAGTPIDELLVRHPDQPERIELSTAAGKSLPVSVSSAPSR